MTVLVAGGAGTIGTHLCDRLLSAGEEVVCVDNFVTASRDNVAHLETTDAFGVVELDVAAPGLVEALGHWRFSKVFHLASPASPVDFATIPFTILAAGSEGTRNLLEVASRDGARFVLASTSEVYGDPEVSPQSEEYLGRVSTTGPRSVYDEAKRFAEAMTAAFGRHRGTDVAIARIFNTYGPRSRDEDGRVVPTFIRQAMAGEPLTVLGSPAITRSFCYVEDLIDGLMLLAESTYRAPVNLGNDEEVTMAELAGAVLEAVGVSLPVRVLPGRVDDPSRRRPDLSLAARELGFRPRTPLREGLRATIDARRATTAVRAAGVRSAPEAP